MSRVTLPKTFYGLCFTPNGERLLVSGGEDDVVYEFRFAGGLLSDREAIELPKHETAQVTAGLACSHDGQWLYAACCLGNRLVALPLQHPEKQQSIAMPVESHPYTVLPSAKTNRLYVSLWGKSSLAVVDRTTEKMAEKIEAIWPTASHPTEMALSPDEDLLYVACADSNTVSVIDTQIGPADRGHHHVALPPVAAWQHAQQPGPGAQRQNALGGQRRCQQPGRDRCLAARSKPLAGLHSRRLVSDKRADVGRRRIASSWPTAKA